MTDEAAWFTRRRDPQTAHRMEDSFQTWLVAQPQNAVRYAQCELAWERVGELSEDAQVGAWLRDADSHVARGDRGTSVVPTPTLRGRRKAHAGFSRRLRWAAAASVLLAVGVAGMLGVRHFSVPVYQTQIGEQRDVRLPDGSHVTLNTGTRMMVRYGAARRQIELITGEALFDVRRDAARPFEVLAGAGIARAIGTKFAVQQTGGRVTVSVLEGIVAVLPRGSGGGDRAHGHLSEVAAESADRALPALESGQAASVAGDGRMSAVEPANIRRIQAWQDRKLDFESEPLGAAIAEVNRYAARPLVLGQPELADLRISGVFHIASLDGFAFALQRSFGLRVVESEGELLVLR